MIVRCVSILLFCFCTCFVQAQVALHCSPVIQVTAANNPICTGNATRFDATVTFGGTAGSFQWKKNNTDVAASGSTFSTSGLKDGDVIRCDYSAKTECGRDTVVSSNPIVMRVTESAASTIAVLNSDTLICERTPTTFTTSYDAGWGNPNFQWLVNGTDVNTNAAVFTTNSLENGSNIKCYMTVSFPGCTGVTRTAVGEMSIYSYPQVRPTIKITPSQIQICRGETASFTATANGGSYPSFKWQVNGVNTGPSAPSFSTASLLDGDVISCEVIIDPETKCPIYNSAASNSITMQVKTIPQPEIALSKASSSCAGSLVRFTATDKNGGDVKTYQWFVNNKAVSPGGPDYSSNRFANGDKISCTLSSMFAGCSSNIITQSDTQTLVVYTPPVVSFASADTSILYGQYAALRANVSQPGCTLLWDPAAQVVSPQAANTNTLALFDDITFRLFATNAQGCTASASYGVKVFFPLYMPNSFTPNGDGKNDVFRIPPRSSLQLDELAIFDRWGSRIFTSTQLSQGWDGSFQGRKAAAGSYVYYVKGRMFNKPVVTKGVVVLVR